jgi:hypothetical protein
MVLAFDVQDVARYDLGPDTSFEDSVEEGWPDGWGLRGGQLSLWKRSRWESSMLEVGQVTAFGPADEFYDLGRKVHRTYHPKALRESRYRFEDAA